MSATLPRFRGLQNVARVALIALIVACLATVAYGGYRWFSGGILDVALLAGGLIPLALGILLYVQMALTLKAASSAARTYDAQLDAVELLRRQNDALRTISENSSLSEWAKRIVYREKDYEYLRDTIQAASVRQDWVSAERLIRELDEQFGLKEEAARLREDLTKARRATAEEKVAAAVQRFESLCHARKWDQARRESQRLAALFPDEPRMAGLAHELDLRRQQHKRALLKEYEGAVKTQNVDAAHKLLFELDHYLAPNEAAALKDSARSVFRAKLQQMGVQFTLAVEDKHFQIAIDVGERLVREFPNSRYAQEIAGMMPVLRQRAVQETGRRES